MNANTLARQSTVLDIIGEYEVKTANVDAAVKAYDDACTAVEMAGAIMGTEPGGRLISILPATAHYDHGEIEGEWRDLPVGSFAEAGTNVPTGLLKIRRAG